MDAVVKTVEHGEASNLPEIQWGWRRTYVFIVTGLLCAHVGWTSYHMTDVGTLRMTIRNDQGLILLFALLYLAGASTEAITKLFAAVRTTRKETVTSAPPPATIVTPQAVVEQTSTTPEKPSWST